MKKILVGFSKIFLIITLLFFGLFFIYKINVKNNLENKLKYLNENWTELLKSLDKKNNLLGVLMNQNTSNIQFVDSLDLNLEKYTKNKVKVRVCNSSFVYEQYLSNKYMLPLLNFYSKNIELVNIQEKNVFNDVKNNIILTNKIIEKYNYSVKVYNKYFSRFPNFMIAKSYDFKRQYYFEIKFGLENKDPKIAKKERRKWQREIEVKNGLIE